MGNRERRRRHRCRPAGGAGWRVLAVLLFVPLNAVLTACLMAPPAPAPPSPPSPSAMRSSATPTPAEPIEGWSRVTLPGDFLPSSLAVDDSVLWIGGVASGDRQPRVAVLGAAATSAPRALPRLIRLRPVSPYAEKAEIVSLAVSPGRVAALGGVRDGAHSNVRWSVWRGDARGLQEHPQGFNTFGGPQAGDLVDIVLPSSGPVIVGTWSGVHGLDGAAWLPAGDRWVRQDSAGTVLASSARNQVSPRAAIGDGDRVLMLGSQLELGTSLLQRPAVWTWASRRGGWTRRLLPSSGRRGEVLSAGCGGPCEVFGHVDDRLAGWRIGPDEPAALAGLPDIKVASNKGASALLATTGAGHRFGLAFTGNDGQGRLLLETAKGWRLYATPTGVAGRAVGVGERIYLVVTNGSERGLWTADLGPVLS